MEKGETKFEAQPTLAEEHLNIIKQKLFAAYSTLENRQEALAKIISGFEWYLWMRKLFDEKKGDEQKTEEERIRDMDEYLDEAGVNSVRLKEFNNIYGLPTGGDRPKLSIRELELLLQDIKQLSLESFKDRSFPPIKKDA